MLSVVPNCRGEKHLENLYKKETALIGVTVFDVFSHETFLPLAA